jgi:putative membrane protein
MTRNQKTSILALASLVVLATPQLRAAGDDTTSNRGQFSKDDYRFACEAARGGMMEVQAGELARTRGFDLVVKQFGERMVADHSQAGEQLKALAARKGAILPSDLAPKEQHLLDSLSKLSGKDFDKAYAASMLKDHKADLKEFQKESEQASDQDLKAFAATTVGLISQHLDAAKQMKAVVERESQTAAQ